MFVVFISSQLCLEYVLKTVMSHSVSKMRQVVVHRLDLMFYHFKTAQTCHGTKGSFDVLGKLPPIPYPSYSYSSVPRSSNFFLFGIVLCGVLLAVWCFCALWVYFFSRFWLFDITIVGCCRRAYRVCCCPATLTWLLALNYFRSRAILFWAMTSFQESFNDYITKTYREDINFRLEDINPRL